MTWLSYLFPISIYKGRTLDNSPIEVREVLGHNKLDMGGYPQSGVAYTSCWKSIFKQANLDQFPEAGSVLVLGLGGGDIAKLFEKIKPEWHSTFVEIEPQIVKIAKTYFDVGNNSKRRIITTDAKLYIEKNKNKFDLIIVDLYIGDNVPDFVTSMLFLKNINLSLKPRGYALFNYASHSFQKDDFVSFENKLKKVFAEVKLLKYMGHNFYLTQN